MSNMMMNERVEMCGDGVVASGVDEKLALLHRMLKRIAKARAHLDLQEAEALREAQQLKLWRQFGHVSLADYMVQELGYASHRAAEDQRGDPERRAQLLEGARARAGCDT